MQDCYKLLNVNRSLILQKTITKEWNEANVDAYIKRCYNETVKKEVEIPKKAAIVNFTDELALIDELERLEQVQKFCDEAYEIIGTEEGRLNYAETAATNEKIHAEQVKNEALQEKFSRLKKQHSTINQRAEMQKEGQISKYAEFREKYQQRIKQSPYKVLNIVKENFEKLSFKEKMQKLNDKKEVVLKKYSSILNQSQNFIERAEISIKINEVAEAYEDLKKQLEEKRYDHTEEYQPDLIKGMLENNTSIENKIVIRQKNREIENEKINKSKEKSINENMYNGERHISDHNRRNLRVRMIAKIGYQNTNNEKRWLYEYQVARRINGEDVTDVVISPMSIAEILLDKKGIGNESSIKLYHYLANELLSEETIKKAQKNAGFIGSIKQNEEGEYYLTLDQNELDLEEQEMLTAIMIWKEKERQKNEEGR